MYVIASKRAEKAIRKLERNQRSALLETITVVTDLLANNSATAHATLQQQYSDHALKGNMRSNRELHLDRDVLLIYKVHKSLQLIELRDIVNHEELRRM